VRAVQNSQIIYEDDLRQFITQSLGIEPSSNLDSILKNQLFQLRNCFISTPAESGKHYFSSIHRSKGLEADGVLAVTRTENEINKWFTTDKEERYKDKGDQCRIGFVAYSRAKQVLCIACLKKISQPTIEKIQSFGVKFL
jgi:DNA helicase-2/ATP-dependent DNA helicase PcrA